ncbi:hypothetical protein G7Y89_g12332 [Cudoniella acicularis]|uniref:Uncharacterized protein n=1 Tax=Cudoniella acicularis TaxID=354080 RepID=A0A8H4VZ97_9HELO|nr:hypothetical protein G7Y89_g12332 [Cudoniella acicularis]
MLSGGYPSDVDVNAPSVDVNAIHGLDENEFETWTDSEADTLWLRDLFPHRNYNVRVLTYGYAAENLASPGEGTTDQILPYANSFIAERELAGSHQRAIISRKSC